MQPPSTVLSTPPQPLPSFLFFFFFIFFFSRVIRSFVRVLGLLLPRGIVVGKKPVYAALDPIIDWSELKFGEEPLQLVVAGLRHVTGGVTSCMPPS